MPEPLPPYSGENPTCAKCSHTEAMTEYKAQGEPRSGSGSWHGMGRERLERRCLRCGYQWDEDLNPPKERT